MSYIERTRMRSRNPRVTGKIVGNVSQKPPQSNKTVLAARKNRYYESEARG